MSGYTLGDVIDNTLQKLKEEVVTPTFWDRSEIQRYILEAIRLVAEALKIFKKNRILVVVVGKRKYEFPDNFIELNRIEFDEKVISPTSSSELDALSENWRSRGGNPVAFFRDQCDPEFFEVYKRPDVVGDEFELSSKYGVITAISSTGDTWTFSSGYGVITEIESSDDEWEFDSDCGVITEILTPKKNLNVFYAGYPEEPSSETNFMPKPFYKSSKLLEDYAMWQALTKEGEAQNLVKAKEHKQDFIANFNTLGKRKDSSRRPWVLGAPSRGRRGFTLGRYYGPGYGVAEEYGLGEGGLGEGPLGGEE